MACLLLILPALASLLLAAHFYRAGQFELAGASAALLVLLAVPRAWAARLLQVALVAGCLEWMRTLVSVAAVRLSIGQPYLRMALILGAVAAFTLLAAAVFQHRRLRTRYRLR
jgi:hypothetical protein